MPEILIKDLTKSFDNGRVLALSNVNLTIHHGEYVFILGPSGCGKTTLLRLISGLISPTTGQILINGIEVTHDDPQQRGIAFVFQNFEIFPISVWENCVYSLTVRGFSDDYIVKQGERSLKIVGLLDRADEIPIGWGNGELQRIGIARAICSGASILIMDEPLGSLDPKISAEFRWELRNIIKDNQLTAIQVTHNQEEAMNVGDRIIIMREGKILQEEDPEQIYKYPGSLFVGNFLGGINILEGYIIQIESSETYHVKLRLGGPELIVFLPINQPDRFRLDENVILALRYEDVYLFPRNYDFSKTADEWTAINFFDAEVIDHYLTGKERFFIISLDTGDTLQVKKPEVFQYRFPKGTKIKVGIFIEDLRIFKYPNNLQKEIDLQ
jgi:ABC-type Fe3+/spermidine/putrescine transport system ATPase subunit